MNSDRRAAVHETDDPRVAGDRPSEAGPPSGAGDQGDMPSEEFRRRARDVVEWIADYLAEVEDYPVLARVEPGDVRAGLQSAVPEKGDPMEEVLRDFRDVVMPGVTHWNHPSFHGYFAVTGSGPGILGEMLTAALNVNAMVWRSSPAGTELEEHTLDWLRQMLGLPDGFEGVINDTASSSSLFALAAAREAKIPEAREDGLFGAPRARIYASEEAHSSIDKAAMTLGFGRHGVKRVAVDAEFQMDVDALREAIERDVEAGIRPVAVVATVGTTSTTSVDPVDAVADVAEEHGLWLHVDSAYAGAAAIVPELKPRFRGWERADSVVMNPHKWLFTPVDCSALFCRRPEMLRAAFSLTPEYLRTREEGVARNLMDYGVALGRRFRSLKLWFVLRYFGRAGIESRIREHCRLASEFARWVDDAPDWERVAPVPFSTIVFRYAPEDRDGEAHDLLNRRILDRVNETGEVFLSHTVLRGRHALRLSIGNLRTRTRHLERTWELLRESADVLGQAVPAEGTER